MTTILLDSEYSDELTHMNEDSFYEYEGFRMDDLYPNQVKLNNEQDLESCRASDSSEEEEYDYKPNAPPPSPQDTSMLDMFFSQKLASSLECLVKKEPFDHAQLLRRTMNQPQGRGICKRNLKRSSYTLQTNSLPWSTSRSHKTYSMVGQAEKLKKALQKHLMDEETSVMIDELKDMGL
ncbi:hypothetical protein INT47_000022 [Mucor saturninus]|uniref:Uncharacterized protein n=1 Tax=Mucor saturninus TaxID=64648 RepID=A0A8H7RJN8_9FUNG|nr:hypothetical protein INT47_000022 [Mucor saturninus]